MAEVQIISSITNLVQLTLNAGVFLQQIVNGATVEAKKLSEKTDRVNRLTTDIAKVLKQRQASRGRKVDSTELSIYLVIEESITDLHAVINSIERRLDGFQNESQSRLETVLRNCRFVCSEQERRDHERTIEHHLQTLNVAMTLLNTHDSSTGGSNHPDPPMVPQARIEPIELQPRRPPANQREQDDKDEIDSLLVTAIKRKEVATVKQLIQSGADLDATDAQGRTFLHHVATIRNEKVQSVLLGTPQAYDYKFLNAQTTDGKTVLMIAAETLMKSSSYDLACEVIKRGCSVNLRDKANRSALSITLDSSVHEEVRVDFACILRDHGADVEWLRTVPEHRQLYDRFISSIRDSTNQNCTRIFSGVQGRRSSASSGSGTCSMCTAVVPGRRFSEADLERRRIEPSPVNSSNGEVTDGWSFAKNWSSKMRRKSTS